MARLQVRRTPSLVSPSSGLSSLLDLAPGFARCIDLAGSLGPGPDTTVIGANPGDALGTAIASGDVNGDGFTDLLVGAPMADLQDRSNAGHAYLIAGKGAVYATVDIKQNQQDFTIYGANINDWLGSALATGDINKDGFSDIIVGAPGADGPNEARTGAGEAYVILGQAAFPANKVMDLGTTKAHITIYGADISDELGRSVAAGQIGQDEIDDVLIGAPGADSRGNSRPRAGEAYIVLGSIIFTSGLSKEIDTCIPVIVEVINCSGNTTPVANSAKPDILFFGADTGDRLGSTAHIADVTSDSIEDIFIGARDADGLAKLKNESGEVYTVFGSPALENKPPVANAGSDQPPPTVCVSQTVQLDGSRSSDPEKNLLFFKWMFISKPTGSLLLDPPAVMRPTFIPDKSGEYVLELTVHDGFGIRGPEQIDRVKIQAIICGPVVIEAPSLAFYNDYILMRAKVNGVTDIQLVYHWEFVCSPAGAPRLNNQGNSQASFFATAPGLYCIKVTVDGSSLPLPQSTAEAKIRVSSIEATPMRTVLDYPSDLGVPDLGFGCVKARSKKTATINVKNKGDLKFTLQIPWETSSIFRKSVQWVRLNPEFTKKFTITFRPPTAGTFYRIIQFATKPDLGFQPRPYVIKGKGVDALSECNFSPLSRYAALTPTLENILHTITFNRTSLTISASAAAQEVNTIRIQMMNLAGARILDREVAGDTLDIALATVDGHKLANGIYLYVVTVVGINGDMQRSGLQKIIFQR